METKQQKTQKLGNMRKVYGVPRLPHKIDAMYDNVCRGNLMAYYLDSNPARTDEAYLKLASLLNPHNIFNRKPYEKVALHYQNSLMARQMNEETYNRILSTPEGRLKLDFCLLFSGDKSLREKIEEENRYMFGGDRKEWTDFSL